MSRIIVLFLVLIITFSLLVISDVIYNYRGNVGITTGQSPIVIEPLLSSPFASLISSQPLTLRIYVTNSTNAYFIDLLNLSFRASGYFYVTDVTLSSQSMISSVAMVLKNSTSSYVINLYPTLSQTVIKVYPNQNYNVSFILTMSGTYSNSPITLNLYYSFSTENNQLGVPR